MSNGKYTLVEVAQLAELVQALTDAQALLDAQWSIRYTKPDRGHDARNELQRRFREKFFHGKQSPLV